MTGRIHSFQSLGCVDGPGIRGIIFFQGCPLRCVYCHNPDTWESGGGECVEAEALAARVLRYRQYYKGGGVTLSGGEPLMQAAFAGELLSRLREAGLHTALDTSGIASREAALAVLPHTDMVLCDLKFADEEAYRRYTRGALSQVLDFLRETERASVTVWLRHVVVPGLTDTPEEIQKVAQIAAMFSNIRKIELLPFRKLCLTKYQALGISFPLENTPECTEEQIEVLSSILPINLLNS